MADQDPYAATAVKPGKKTAKAAAPADDPYAATAVQAFAPPPAITPPTAPPEGFWSSVAAPFVGAAKGLKSAIYEGPQNPSEAAIVGANEKDPSWQSPILGRAVLAAKRLLVDPQLEQGRQAVAAFHEAAPTSLHPTPEQLSQRQLALGHGLASVVPFVGPWAASVGQKEGEQLGAENYSGMAGTAFGNALLALTPKAIGKAGEIVRNAPEALARAITDTGAGPVKELVKKAQTANEKIDADNSVARSYNSAAENTLELRRQHEQALQQQTSDYYAKEAAADTRAKGEENSAWSAWRQKMAGKTIDGGQIAEQLKSIAAISPETVRVLRQLQPPPEDAPPESLYAQDRAAIMKSQGYTGGYFDYPAPIRAQIDRVAASSGFEPEPIDFDPQAGKPLPVEQVHRASSILQRYIRSGRFEGTLLGEMKQTAKVLRAAITRASADAGAATDLATARNSTITYQEAFGKEPHPPATARTVREKQANPEAFRERADEDRLAAARRYDPTLVDGYRQVKAAREALKKFPSEDQLRRGLQQTALRQKISAPDLVAARRAAAEARAGKAQTRGTWVATWPVFQAMRALWGGHIPSLPAMALESAGTFATTKAATTMMKYPPLLNFLTKARPEDLASIPPDLRGDLPGLVTLAQRQGIKVAPALVAATAGAAGQPSQQVQQPALQGAQQ